MPIAVSGDGRRIAVLGRTGSVANETSSSNRFGAVIASIGAQRNVVMSPSSRSKFGRAGIRYWPPTSKCGQPAKPSGGLKISSVESGRLPLSTASTSTLRS